MSDRLALIELPSGLYTWNRYGHDEDGEPTTVRAGGTWLHEADAFDAMIDAHDDHEACTIEFYDRASRAEGNGKHVKAPEVGHPIAPGRWSKVDPHALDE